MFNLLIGPKIPTASTNFLSQMDTTIKNNQSFLRTIEKWRNLEISYIGKLAQLQSEAEQRKKKLDNDGDSLLIKVLENLQMQHKSLTNKYNHDIFMVNFAESEKSVYEQKIILQNEKQLHKQLCMKKEILEKVRESKLKLKKTMEEELTLHVFSLDSVQATVDKKMKRFNKMKKIEKEQEEYELKVKQTKQIFDQIIENGKYNLRKFNLIQKSILEHRSQMVKKFQLHLTSYSKNLVSDMEEFCKKIIDRSLETCIYCDICNEFLQDQQQKILSTIKIQEGYLEATLRIINDKTLDQIIEYSKDRQIKKKIKKIIESDETSPQQTDQFTRQVQIVKKMLRNKEYTSLSQYKSFIVKGYNFRLNFVFILQLNRLNSQFQIRVDQTKTFITMINQFLCTCHENKDSFCLKQIMVLMLTYYVSYFHEGREEKIYIMNFFKHHQFWKDLQLWQSILIQCIYLEKKATIKMILSTSVVSNKGQLLEAEKTSILNQILYVVRNMILFDFSEKQVKQFSNKFVKMLKQDDKFLKDVYRSIDNAIKQEAQNKPPEVAYKFIQDIIKLANQP